MSVPKRAEDYLIVALDFSDPNKAKKLVESLQPKVSFFKVGWELFLTDRDIIHWLIERNLKVFLDVKIDDVLNTIRQIVRILAGFGIKFLTIRENGPTIQAAAEGRNDAREKGENGLKLLSITFLTSLDLEDLRRVYHSQLSVKNFVIRRAENAIEHGCDGLITSGQNVRDLRKRLGSNPIIVCPGIRAEEDPSHDHKRTSTPFDAIHDGADYLVVGRPIRNAQNPLKKTNRIIQEIERALAERA